MAINDVARDLALSNLRAGGTIGSATTAAYKIVGRGISSTDLKQSVDSAYRQALSEGGYSPAQRASVGFIAPAPISTATHAGQVFPVNYSVRYQYFDRNSGRYVQGYVTIRGDGSESEDEVIAEAEDAAAQEGGSPPLPEGASTDWHIEAIYTKA